MRRLSDRPNFRGRSGLLVSRPDVCIAVSMHPWWVSSKVERSRVGVADQSRMETATECVSRQDQVSEPCAREKQKIP